MNGGNCTGDPFTKLFTCSCTSDFEGPTCTTPVDFCTSNPCQNGGLCANTGLLGPGVKKTNCTCDNQGIFSGEYCEIGEVESCLQLYNLNLTKNDVYNMKTLHGSPCEMVKIVTKMYQITSIKNIFNNITEIDDCMNLCLNDASCKVASFTKEPYYCLLHIQKDQIEIMNIQINENSAVYEKQCQSSFKTRCEFDLANNKIYTIIKDQQAPKKIKNVPKNMYFKHINYGISELQMLKIKNESSYCEQSIQFSCNRVDSDRWSLQFFDFTSKMFNDGIVPNCANCLLGDSCWQKCRCSGGIGVSTDMGTFKEFSKIPLRSIYGGGIDESYKYVTITVGDMKCTRDLQKIDPCTPNPCGNGGTCYPKNLSFECQCQQGYGGDVCQYNINECGSSPCSVASTISCVDGLNKYTCNCILGYTGKSCETG